MLTQRFAGLIHFKVLLKLADLLFLPQFFCQFNPTADGLDGIIDLKDFAVFAEHYLE